MARHAWRTGRLALACLLAALLTSAWAAFAAPAAFATADTKTPYLTSLGTATVTPGAVSVDYHAADGTGSGWAYADGARLGELDSASVARVAIDKALLSQKPRKLDPGRYTVILEPAAVADLVLLLFSGAAFDARAADEGRDLRVLLRTERFHVLGIGW